MTQEVTFLATGTESSRAKFPAAIDDVFYSKRYRTRSLLAGGKIIQFESDLFVTCEDLYLLNQCSKHQPNLSDLAYPGILFNNRCNLLINLMTDDLCPLKCGYFARGLSKHREGPLPWELSRLVLYIAKV